MQKKGVYFLLSFAQLQVFGWEGRGMEAEKKTESVMQLHVYGKNIQRTRYL